MSASGVSASGMSASGVSASGSGSGSVCPDTQFQIFGPLCVTAMQGLCSFNFSSETCDMCNTLLSLCGPFEGNTSTLCASEMAINCSQTSRTCFNVQTVAPTTCDLCAFVGSVCFQGREFELCPVEGLVDGCTSVLNRSPFVCECFLPSFQCMFCRTLLDVCTATIPVSYSTLVRENGYYILIPLVDEHCCVYTHASDMLNVHFVIAPEYISVIALFFLHG